MSAARDSAGVVVVTGGAVGIGAAIAEELGRNGVFVVTVDPGVAVDGTPQSEGEELTTAQRIVDAGGRARASNISVTDGAAVHGLFAGLVEEFGTLDAVVNVAGITRPTGLANGTEDDWQALLSVHLDGYLNVLRAALPIMTAAGHGRILGVTSGSGWRPADAGAYSCAKRAVAALTWRLGQEVPDGVTVNALSPIAATRMVLGALSRQAGAGNASGRDSATGGVSLALSAVPPPEHLGPIGAYLASDQFSSWSRGQIMFSNGAEVAWVVPPRLLEVVRTDDVKSLPHLLDALGPAVLVPAEAAQGTNGGGNPRVGTAFDDAEPAAVSGAGRCVVFTDSSAWRAPIADALAARGLECVSGPEQPATGFASAAEQLDAVAREAGPIDAVVLALVGTATPRATDAVRVGAGARRALGHHRSDPHGRGMGSRRRGSRGRDRAPDEGRHDRRRDDGRREEPGPGRDAALPGGARSDRRSGGRVRARGGDRRGLGATVGRRAHRVPGEQWRRGRAVGRRARRRFGVVRAAHPPVSRREHLVRRSGRT